MCKLYSNDLSLPLIHHSTVLLYNTIHVNKSLLTYTQQFSNATKRQPHTISQQKNPHLSLASDTPPVALHSLTLRLVVVAADTRDN